MNKTASFGGLLAFISNPAVLAAVGVGALILTVMEALSGDDDEQDNASEAAPNDSVTLTEPLEGVEFTVPATVVEPFETVEVTVEPTAHSSVEDRDIAEALDDGNNDMEQSETVSAEAVKKEMIRQAMSELGKRSAAARAKKKSNIQE
jgi:hypothetical protein